jgi:hypothetical protein
MLSIAIIIGTAAVQYETKLGYKNSSIKRAYCGGQSTDRRYQFTDHDGQFTDHHYRFTDHGGLYTDHGVAMILQREFPGPILHRSRGVVDSR